MPDIHVRLLQSSERDKWDAFVSTHPSSTPYHMYAWCQAVASAYGFTPLYFTAFENDNIVGIFPMIHMRGLTGKKELCSLPYCDIGGPSTHHQQAQEALLNFAVDFAQKSESQLILRSFKPEVVPVNDVSDGIKVRMLLDLPDNADLLMKSFKSKLRSQIRKAEKNGLTSSIINGQDVTSHVLHQFYNVLSENMRDLGSPVHSLKWYQQILQHYQDDAFISLVFNNDHPVGAALVIRSGSKAVIPWASTRQKFNRLAPNMLLYWSVLSHCADNGMKTFDFGRSTVGEGTFRFKKQWGCDAQALDWKTFYDGEEEAMDTAPVSTSRALVENIWQKLPLPVANFVGPKLRRYINL